MVLRPAALADQAEAGRPSRCRGLRLSDHLLWRAQAVDGGALAGVVRRLRAEGTVFRAVARLDIADAAQIDHLAAASLADAIGGGAEGKNIVAVGHLLSQVERFGAGEAIARDDTLNARGQPGVQSFARG